MDILPFAHQGVLFAHLVSFAIALSAVLREDLALISAQHIDLGRLAGTARVIRFALGALWITGLGLVAFDVGADVSAFVVSPKLAAKLAVVSTLTANGLALHLIAFPMLRRRGSGDQARLVVPVVLGAISTVSWLYASFVGAARLIAPAISFAGFMAVYAVLLASAIAVALVFVSPRVARLPIVAQ
jgi:hypothetical protein